MAINDKLLRDARGAEALLAGAEREVQRARSEYHALVRRMHLAGGSLREIALALGLSHQRVQQMIQGAGGTWWRRIWRTRRLKGNLVCTFCRRPESEVNKLIAGPKVFICDVCVDNAARRIAGINTSAPHESPGAAPAGSRARCSFCRKRQAEGRVLLTSAPGNICGECLGICRQILSDSAP